MTARKHNGLKGLLGLTVGSLSLQESTRVDGDIQGWCIDMVTR